MQKALTTLGLGIAFAAGAAVLLPFATAQEAEPPVALPEDPAPMAPDEGEGAPTGAEAPGDEASGVSLMAALFDGLSEESVRAKVAEFYDPSAVYEDPFGRYEQRDEIQEHLSELLAGASSVAFEVREEFQSGDETVALWTLSVNHPKLGGEAPVVIEGVTHARFVNGKIAEQRDYYDVGALVYEHVSLIGSLVRWVKAKVAHD